MGDWERAELMERKGIRDRRVLAAIRQLRRADFVPPELERAAWEDAPLPIGQGQTISQPFVVAFMTEALALEGGERVLEIGTGSGYQTAVLALLAHEVYTLEIVPELAASARERLERMGYRNVRFRQGDGAAGWPEAAPFDAILSAAAAEAVPPALVAQLAPGGRMVLPVGPQGLEGQDLLRLRLAEPGAPPSVERLLPVRFVPMTGGSAPLPH